MAQSPKTRPDSQTDSRNSSASEGDLKSIRARVTATPKPLRVDSFVQAETPGNVGLALCGGGSRAMASALGQLRALANIRPCGESADGSPLLGLSKAVSAVSGGSWLSAPFMFLPESISDQDYLGTMVADPGQLVPGKSPLRPAAEELGRLPSGYAGQSVGHPRFTVVGLAIQLVLLKRFGKVPNHRLWQTVIGLNVLKPFGLYAKPSRSFEPTTTFSQDAQTRRREIVEPNPDLADYPAHLVAAGTERIRRPFWICNTSMFVNEPAAKGFDLVPVQSTPFFTGILSSPDGVDANGFPVGGSAVATFAFNSQPHGQVGEYRQLSQDRPFALTDIVGLSSVAFAAALETQIDAWRRNHQSLAEELMNQGDMMTDWYQENFDSKLFQGFDRLLHKPALQKFLRDSKVGEKIDADLHQALNSIQDLIPEATYWSVDGAAAAEAKGGPLNSTRFADGGNLENTGVGALLAYQDIDRIVAFINSPTPMAQVDKGVLAIDSEGHAKEVADSRILVDSQVVNLFGYQSHSTDHGYRLFRSTPFDQLDEADKPFRNNQLFESEELPALLRGLWSSSHGKQRPALFEQRLKTVANPLFGVTGGRTVRVLWLYLDTVQDWLDQLSKPVAGLLKLPPNRSFPNYSTNQGLNPTQINLLAHFTSWCLANPEQRTMVQDFFQPAS